MAPAAMKTAGSICANGLTDAAGWMMVMRLMFFARSELMMLWRILLLPIATMALEFDVR